jgi:DNA-binding transcriptional ArsR family regulator
LAAKAATGHRDKRKREKKPRKRIEDAVLYALAHEIRVEILILLNEADYTMKELAELTGVPLTTVSNHVRRMLDDGAVEIAKEELRRATNMHWYRAVELPEYTQREAEELTQMERQVTAGLVVQSGTAEVMAALRKGNLADARTILSWDWYTVDAEGRSDLEAENARHLERVREIECEAVNRVAASKEETTSVVVSLFTFERAREARRPRSHKRERNQQTD